MSDIPSDRPSLDQPSWRLSRPLASILVIGALLVGAFWIYLQMFSNFAVWDDEGLLMFHIAYLLKGHAMYDVIYAQYGPFYYLYQWSFFLATGLAITHEHVRMLAAALWLTSAGLLSYLVRRMSGSWIITGFAFFAIMSMLGMFSEDPGHPEEILLVLVGLLLLLCARVRSAIPAASAAALGVMVACIGASKINLGFYCTMALLLTFFKVYEDRRVSHYLYWLIGLFGLIAAAKIMSPLWTLGWARNYTVVVLVGLLSVLAASSRRPAAPRCNWKTLLIFAGSGVLAAVVTAIPFLLHGTTVSKLLYMTIFQYKDFAKNWYFAMHTGIGSSAIAIVSITLCLLWTSKGSSPGVRRWLLPTLQIAKGLAALYALTFMTQLGSLHPIGFAIFPVLTVSVWLLLVPATKGELIDFGRLALAWLSVWISLYPFPVAGAQVGFSVAVLLSAAALLMADAVTALRAWQPRLLDSPARHIASAVLLLVLAVLFEVHIRASGQIYRSHVPLDLPGARLLRVDRHTYDTFHWLIPRLRQNCDTFYSSPGLYSFYFWVDEKPPTLRGVGSWVTLLNAAEQQAIVNELAPLPRECMISVPRLTEFWRRGQDLSQSPLARYINDNFVTVDERNGYRFMMRKGAQPPQ